MYLLIKIKLIDLMYICLHLQCKNRTKVADTRNKFVQSLRST